MPKFIRRHFEIALIKVAIAIIHGRNVQRCTVVSRRDNNDMYYMGEKLEAVCDRMKKEYNVPPY